MKVCIYRWRDWAFGPCNLWAVSGFLGCGLWMVLPFGPLFDWLLKLWASIAQMSISHYPSNLFLILIFFKINNFIHFN